ncbi:GGDEF domain-containing protein [Colwellia sp. D2M02]|nr:GGDEF domain-containing protein [Colwellia sp. D2M02]
MLGAFYIPVCQASTVAAPPSQILNLILSFILGAIIMGLFAFYQCRATRRQYQKKDLELKQAITDIEQSKIALQALVEEQKQSQDLLEDRVQERTLELNITLQELESVNQELERKNVSDELTGLHNRRFYDQKIQAEYRRSRRNLTPLSLVIIDIDHFKSVNDTYGHLVGDQCLIWLSKHIQKSLKRSTDKAFRYGGEEFCLILPDTDLTGAIALAEKLRETIATEHFQFEQANFSVTISCGVSTYQQQNDVTPEQLFSVADKALYKAKHNGRNQTQYHQFT